jgi:hypothetical protein
MAPVSNTIDHELAERHTALTAKLKADLEAYARTALKIRAKDSVQRPLIFNRAQQYIHDQLEAQRATTGKVRAIILKGATAGVQHVPRRPLLSPRHALARMPCVHPHPRGPGDAEPVRHGAALSPERTRFLQAIDAL